jgi:hypothetical protein
MADRMIGAARLDVATYEEVESDYSATGQAALVVAIVALASAIGGAGAGGVGILGGIFSAIVGWLVWAGIAYLIGDKLFGGTASWGELLRTLGFAQAPGVLLILAIIPVLGWVVQFVVGIWLLVAGVIAIRQALDFSTGRAILTAIVGWIPLVIVRAILF